MIIPFDKNIAKIKLCKLNFEAFCRTFWDCIPTAKKLVWNWHMSVMCQELQEIAERVFAGEHKKHDLICNVHPGSSKTFICTILYTCWVWTRMPKARLLLVSYGDDLVSYNADKIRDVLKHPKYQEYFPEVVMSKQDSKHKFFNTLGGEVHVATVLGISPLGRHFDMQLCLPWEALIITEAGALPIGKIVDECLPVKVLAFDHETNSLEWKKIEEYQTNPGRPLCKVEFTDGTSLSLTDGHEVYVYGIGYVPAAELMKGDEVRYAISMRGLRQGKIPLSSPCRKSETHLLLGGMPVFGVVGKGPPKIQPVREGMPHLQKNILGPSLPKGKSKVLQRRVPGKSTRRKTTAGKIPVVVQDLREANVDFEKGIVDQDVLFKGLCVDGSQDKNEREGKLKLRPRQLSGRVSKGIQQDKEIHQEKGQARLRGVRDNPSGSQVWNDRASYRFGQEEQRQGKSDFPLQKLPRKATRDDSPPFETGSKIVASIEREIRIPEKTYNLKIADNHNYFANEILVHNCDDPLDPQRATSEVELDKAKEFFTETLPGRRVDAAVSVMILIMQRIHHLDPSGILLDIAKKDFATPIKHICLPAELPKAGDGSYLPINVHPPELAKNYVDGLVDEKRYPRNVLQSKKAQMTIYAYESQYLQNPTPRGGGLFREEWLKDKFVDCSPYECQRVRAWDIAASATGDFTAGVLMAKDRQGSFYIEDVQRAQYEPDQRDRLILRIAEADRRRYGQHSPTIVLEKQPGAAGIDLYRYLTKMLAGFSIRPYSPSRMTGDKELRAEPLSSQMSIGNVFVVKSHWNEQYIRELSQFPKGVHDDAVDASSMAFSFLTASRPAGTIRILNFQQQQKELRIVVCSKEQYESMVLDESHILIYLDNPAPFSKPLELAPSPQRLRMVSVEIADIDPRDEEWQKKWDKPMYDYGKKADKSWHYPGDLVALPDHGRKVWRCLLQKSGNSPPNSIFVCDNNQGGNDRRAISVACALADVLRIPRESITKMENTTIDVSKPGSAPNNAIYGAIKNSRMMVVD